MQTKSIIGALILLCGLVTQSCSNEKLPVLGRKEYDSIAKDTVYHTVQPFSFINQNEDIITEEYLKGNISVISFFFTSCPSICPIMTKNMQSFQERIKGKYDIQILTHTVDPERDTVGKLQNYIKQNDISTNNWDFVTGDQELIFEAGVFSYLLAAQEDVLAPGGFLHSEKFVLIDKQLRIRGVYDGTDEKQIDKLIKDLPVLINEYEK